MLIRIIIFLMFLNADLCLAQDCLDNILQNSLYTKSGDIINGRQWVNEKRYSGSPLLVPDYWPKGNISYNGMNYPGQVFNYDLYRDELIIYHREGNSVKFVVLNKDKLAGFTFTDTVTNRKHSFEYMELPGTGGKALYENASAGEILFYLRPEIKVELRTMGDGSGDYAHQYEYFLRGDGKFYRIISKSQLVRLFPDHEAELKRYLRNNSFKVSVKDPESMVRFIQYCESLN